MVGPPRNEHTPDLENSLPLLSLALQKYEVSSDGHAIDGFGKTDLGDVNACVLASPSTSLESPAEVRATATDSSEEQCSGKALDGTENRDDGKNRDQSDQVKETAAESATAKSEAPGKVPQPSPVLEHEIKEEFAITKDEVFDHQTQPRAIHKPVGTSKSVYSVPPHMRPEFPSSFARCAESLSSKMLPSNNVPRYQNIPRHNHTHHGSRNDNIPSEQATRLNAQLLKAKQELEQERTKNANLSKTIQDAQHEHLEAAFSTILIMLLREQTEALAVKSRATAHQRSLDIREKKICQQESFLAAGQKHLMTKLEQNGSSMSAAHLAHQHQQMQIDKQAHQVAFESQLALERETLKLHAAAQAKREKQYKTLLRQSLEAEIAANYVSNDEAEALAEFRFQRGFDAGKEEGRKEAVKVKEEKERAYLEGYRACFHAQAALSSLRKGVSDVVQNLLDPTDEDNLFSMGIRVGRMEVEAAMEKGEDNKKKVGSKEEDSMEEDSKDEDVKEEEVESLGYGTTLTPPFSPVPVQRQTLAAELRGYTPLMHNGEVVLANHRTAAAAASPEKEESRGTKKQEGADLIDLL
ncbi:hypothetical protein COCC4DRAFT_58152 [Bipolaris maydis ATCC 48331]|uniref:Uncharacterized protein n=2 Tax=Cochliobolus heterostrophus TaxID=5016 RepID=M2U210_COCH5|nr:uncharacterized protein COCC4DRAFT_58152 [Bipolaris maydis ATCC 48331]EMD92599.1 hypothetical protein COCHEDRAFT_1099296 [Bipolaris maydis C5]KAJ5022409.1 hypothetical protein J3E73DRAFT_198141 [Bipolaris maydis]ENI08295.1 hypothetical protein COCC4DRAFT_58152 [Bipolaris maydis ATCC 48331]KAJ6210375.1 hypothetical protein PSV09DRAFT_1099296 [Bipolaris maydis]KAJ6272094.1 hypothetical protein PSV08DRAFT_177292 [Bipolaris maydis]